MTLSLCPRRLLRPSVLSFETSRLVQYFPSRVLKQLLSLILLRKLVLKFLPFLHGVFFAPVHKSLTTSSKEDVEAPSVAMFGNNLVG